MINDKLDKHFSTITKEIIRRKFISKDDLELPRYDDCINNLLEIYDYKSVVKAVNYTISRIIDNKYIDENGHSIVNLYAYFNSALVSNLERISNKVELDWIDL